MDLFLYVHGYVCVKHPVSARFSLEIFDGQERERVAGFCGHMVVRLETWVSECVCWGVVCCLISWRDACPPTNAMVLSLRTLSLSRGRCFALSPSSFSLSLFDFLSFFLLLLRLLVFLSIFLNALVS